MLAHRMRFRRVCRARQHAPSRLRVGRCRCRFLVPPRRAAILHPLCTLCLPCTLCVPSMHAGLPGRACRHDVQPSRNGRFQGCLGAVLRPLLRVREPLSPSACVPPQLSAHAVAISPPAAAPQQHPQCLRLLCRHCRKLAPVYASLAAKLADDADIVIAQIDGEANDVPGMVPEGFPTIIFFPKARRSMHMNMYMSHRSIHTCRARARRLCIPLTERIDCSV